MLACTVYQQLLHLYPLGVYKERKKIICCRSYLDAAFNHSCKGSALGPELPHIIL